MVAPMATTLSAAARYVRERGHQGGPRWLCGDQPQDRAGDHAERALAADEELQQRESGNVLDPLAAEDDLGAVREHHVEAEHVVRGHPVLDAAQPAGIGGDVAADRADLVRGRVGRIPQAVRGRGCLQLGIERTRLDHRDAGRGVDLDPPHPFQTEHDSAVDGRSAAGQAAAGPARNHRHRMRRRPTQHGLHLIRIGRPDHRQRRAGTGCAGPVEPVVLQRRRLGCHRVGRQGGDQLLDRRSGLAALPVLAHSANLRLSGRAWPAGRP